MSSGGVAPSAGTATAAVVTAPPAAAAAEAVGVSEVTLRLAHPRSVGWAGDVVDNEGLGRKKSKSERARRRRGRGGASRAGFNFRARVVVSLGACGVCAVEGAVVGAVESAAGARVDECVWRAGRAQSAACTTAHGAVAATHLMTKERRERAAAGAAMAAAVTGAEGVQAAAAARGAGTLAPLAQVYTGSRCTARGVAHMRACLVPGV